MTTLILFESLIQRRNSTISSKDSLLGMEIPQPGKTLFQGYGFEAAKEILRNGFIRNDPNLDDELIH
jgi:hypothetical protein